MTTRRVDFFVTGTDTEVGKTLVSAALIAALNDAGVGAVGMKPVAAGLVRRGDGWVSEDAELHAQASPIAVPREFANPYAFREPAAPNLAAARDGAKIELGPIHAAFATLQGLADAVVVEGAGGFRVPLSDDLDGGDLARALSLPVVLVVGMRLGCVNHALLSAEAIAARGLALVGWVANRIDPSMSFFEENVAMLRARLRAPLIGVVPHLAAPDFAAAAKQLDVRLLLDARVPA